LEVRYKPTKVITVLALDKRVPENLAWCAVTYGASRLFWIDGYLICAEVYDKSFEQEIEDGEFTITHLCYAPFPRYCKVLEVGKGTQIPVVKVEDLTMFRELLKFIKENGGEAKSDSYSGEAKPHDVVAVTVKEGKNRISI